MKQTLPRQPPAKPPNSALPITESRKEPVLSTAARMFVERGYLGTSIDDIAGALGSTKGRIYHYYSSKADLYLDVHHAAVEMMIDQITPLVRDTMLTPAEKLRRMAAEQLRMVMSAGPIQKAGLLGIQRKTLKLSTVRQKRAMAAVVKLRDEYENMFVQVIEDGIAQGAFINRPVRLLTKPIQGAINWAHVWFNPDLRTSRAEIEEIIETITEFLLNGLRPHEPAPALPVARTETVRQPRSRRVLA